MKWFDAAVWILGGTAALACAWESETPWLLVGVAMILYARGGWYAYLAVRSTALERDPALVMANAERIYLAGSIPAICPCVVSLLRGEGVLSAVAIVFVIVRTAFHFYLKRSPSPRVQTNSGTL